MQFLNRFRVSALNLCRSGPVQPHINVRVNRFNLKSTYRYLATDKKPISSTTSSLKLPAECPSQLCARASATVSDCEYLTTGSRLPAHRPPVFEGEWAVIYHACPARCFDKRNVSIVRGAEAHAQMITSFMNTHYWPREPSVIALWMPLDSSYLEFLTGKLSYSGERLLAMEYQPRTRERRMIGLSVANRVYPWMIGELEQWGHITDTEPERYRMYFCAHCLKSPNLFKKYNVDYIYDIEVLGTVAEVTGQGVGTLLLKAALDSAHEMRHPLVQVVAVSKYASRICEKCGMEQVWTMQYRDFVDTCGQSVFFPRSPQQTVSIYVKYFDPNKGGEYACKPNF